MIPKVIYYCWFGRHPLPKDALDCINSWKKYAPEYEIVQINEENYHIDKKCEFVKKAYINEKWAFVSDYARLEVIYKSGGVYFDTDVELLKPIDILLENSRGFFGFEQKDSIASGLGFACERGEEVLKRMLDCYESKTFDMKNLSSNACPAINTKILAEYGVKMNGEYQIVNGIKILPPEYLCPENIYTGETLYSKNTISVHHYHASWLPKKERIRMYFIVAVKRRLPIKVNNFIRKLFERKKNEA